MWDKLYWSIYHLTFAGHDLNCEATSLAYFKPSGAIAITICPYAWQNVLTSLNDYRSGALAIVDGTPLASFSSIPATLLHELLHMVTNNGM